MVCAVTGKGMEMRNGFLRVAAAALCAAALLTGCDKPKAKPAEQPQAANAQAQTAPAKPQTVLGSAMERGRATECLSRIMALGQYLMMCGEYLPMSREDFTKAGCSEEMLKCPGGDQYEFLVKEKIRTATSGKTKVLRCPRHELVLYSNGSASSGR